MVTEALSLRQTVSSNQQNRASKQNSGELQQRKIGRLFSHIGHMPRQGIYAWQAIR